MLLLLITNCIIISNFLSAKPTHPSRANLNNFNVPDSLNKGQKNPFSSRVRGGSVPADSLFTSDSLTTADSLITVVDSISGNDTIAIDDKDDIKEPITYNADDSIVYDMETKQMYLYNNAQITYEKIKLNANYVKFDWTTFTLSSEGTKDSTGELTGKPVFVDDGKEYHARRLDYNFKTKKGKVYEVTTTEGDAHLIVEEVKRNEYEEWYGRSTKYSTCDLDHPHFYFKAKKVKIVPNKVLVTGPANLWVGDVPTPLFVPFGLFPVKQGRRSGIILPEYGQDAVMGFFLRNGGYYWAVNDYVSLKFTEMVGTNGTFGAGVSSQYAWRYKFTGNIAFNYLRSRPQDPDLPGAKSTNSYSIAWTHNQDPKSIPNASFGAQVQMQSADFYQASRVTDTRLLNTTFNSAVNFAYNIPRSPLSLSVNLRHTQNLLNRTIGFTLPTFRLSMSRVAPFKAKVQSGKPKWFENIGFQYSFEFQNQLNTYDSILFQKQSTDRFRFGINQTLRIDAPITLFKYLNMNPAFDYQERTYFKGVNRTWNPDTIYSINSVGGVDTLRGYIELDTIWRFNSTRNFNASLSFSTKMIGIFRFKGKLKAIKHVFTPTVSFNYHPDFSQPVWKTYTLVQSDAEGGRRRYSVFEPDAIYGVPGQGREGSINFGLANNLEMKVYDKKDSVNHEKKVGLLDQVSFTGNYNFAADSLRLGFFNLSIVSSRIFNLINLNFGARFDPYITDSMGRRLNTFHYTKTGRLLRFSDANISATMTLHSKQRTQVAPEQNPDQLPKYVGDYVSYDPNKIYNFEIPWNLSLSYRFNLTRGTTFNPDTLITVQSINAAADFNITPKWKVVVSSGFDITRKEVTLTNISVVRDLHCWELSFNWTPPLPGYNFQQFTILLHPKSSTLQELKIQKKNLQQQNL